MSRYSVASSRRPGSIHLLCFLLLSLLLQACSAYQVLISDKDEARQVCSGMWGSGGSREPWIEVFFSQGSKGQLALIIYEWEDARYIGIDADGTGVGQNEWEDERVYVCSLAAYRANLCGADSLGRFIVDVPAGKSVNETSIFTTAVRFDSRAATTGADGQTVPAGINAGPYRYEVKKTGYYCVGAVPLSTSTSGTGDDAADNSTSTTVSTTAYTGVVDFENTFEGHLPAAEYPKIVFYGAITAVYVLLGLAWAYLCWKNRSDILPIQHYVSATIAFVIVEMAAVSGYYRYLNNSPTASFSKVYLAFVSILSAGRNSISFFMLLIVCMGYGVVRPSLGSVMLRARLLAIVHFVFGVMYSVGIVTIPLESAGVFIFFFVFPLAFSLTAFMMWIMWSLNATIQDLESRKQSYKKQMFTRLYRILVGSVIVIAAFFVISSISFSNRLDESYAPETWQSRWWLLDGWLGLLYLACFAAIAFIWRPNSNNRRLAMSDELATDEADADEFEVDTLHHDRLEAEERADGKDGVPGVGGGRYGGVNRDDVVFDIGDEGEEDSDADEPRGGSGSGREKARLSDEEAGARDSSEGQRLRRSGSTDRARQPPRYSSLG